MQIKSLCVTLLGMVLCHSVRVCFGCCPVGFFNRCPSSIFVPVPLHLHHVTMTVLKMMGGGGGNDS